MMETWEVKMDQLVRENRIKRFAKYTDQEIKESEKKDEKQWIN